MILISGVLTLLVTVKGSTSEIDTTFSSEWTTGLQANVWKREAQEYYEPVWNGKGCKDPVDVGRGPGSCNTDCDCPLCSPFCSRSGFCQNHQHAGRRKIALDLCPKKSDSYPPRQKQKYYEPVWNGLQCTTSVDVGLGEGSCNTDCDCPLCAPFCSKHGFCQNNKNSGRRKIAAHLCPQKTQPSNIEASCPAVPGGEATPGCDKTLIQDYDGQIGCRVDDDCPYSLNWWNVTELCSARGFTYYKCVNRRCEEIEIRTRYICDRQDNLSFEPDIKLPSTDRDSVCFTKDQTLQMRKLHQRFAIEGSPDDEGKGYQLKEAHLYLFPPGDGVGKEISKGLEFKLYSIDPCSQDDDCRFLSKALFNSAFDFKCSAGICLLPRSQTRFAWETSERRLFKKLPNIDRKIYRCESPIEDGLFERPIVYDLSSSGLELELELDFCVDDENLLNLAFGGLIIGDVYIPDNIDIGYIDIKSVRRRLCNVKEDCYDLISHWNLRDSFKSSLDMICTTEGQCKSTNRRLWTRGTITGEDFCYQELEMMNVFNTRGPSKDKNFKRCISGPTAKKCDGLWYFNKDFPIAYGDTLDKASPYAGLSSGSGSSGCRFCTKKSCSGRRPCRGPGGGCVKALCNKQGRCWCPTWKNCVKTKCYKQKRCWCLRS